MKIRIQPIAAVLAVAALLAGCASPYADQIRNLDAAHAAGRVSDPDYYKYRQELAVAEGQWRAQVNQQVLAASADVAAQANAQIQTNQASQQALGNAIIANGIQNATAQPRTYDSTVTPTYPGGPSYIHTEQTGGN